MSTLTASHGLTLSSTGLKLIKAYEGYRPVDRTLVSGHRVVGYGHRLFSDDPIQMSKSEAEELLISELQAFEDMINENVHAPLSQGQFDALVSFAYNIGPKAFLKSDTLRALNNGRPLDAANGLDVWRKSTIDGKTYVVDALMRRRTAEKALFLRLDKKPRPAPSVDLPPVKDEDMAALETGDGLPVFTQDETSGVVARAPYDAQTTPTRRREDGPAGILMLSEVVEPETLYQTEEDAVDDFSSVSNFDEITEFETPETPDDRYTEQIDDTETEGAAEIEDNGQRSPNRSVIADAAADISDRLDALIDKVSDEETSTTEDWPEALIQMESSTKLEDTDGPEVVSENIDAGDIKDTAQDKTLTTPLENNNLVEFPGKKDEGNEALQIVRDKNETRVPSKAEIEAAVFSEAKTKKTDVNVIDNLRQDDAMRHHTTSTERYIERHAPDEEEKETGNLGFWMIMLTGFILLGGSLAASLRGAERLLGEWGPLLILSGLIIGAVMVLGAAYYALRRAFR